MQLEGAISLQAFLSHGASMAWDQAILGTLLYVWLGIAASHRASSKS